MLFSRDLPTQACSRSELVPSFSVNSSNVDNHDDRRTPPPIFGCPLLCPPLLSSRLLCHQVCGPGLDGELVKSIGLNHSVEREVVSFQGCGAGINGLRLASQYAVTHPGRLALLVSVELPSLHMHKVKGKGEEGEGGVGSAKTTHH